VYDESALAQALGLRLRLIGKGDEIPAYCGPRLVRFAAFVGSGLLELDIPASHGQQIYKYAVRHGIIEHHPVLEQAFGSSEKIKSFRQHLNGLRNSCTIHLVKPQASKP
jgi:hypothetical protein